MAVFNKVYKKVANNGNSSDYALVGQIGVDGTPLAEYKYVGSSGVGTFGLVPSLNTSGDEYFLTGESWRPFRGFEEWMTEDYEQLYAVSLGGLSKLFSIPINPSAGAAPMGLLNSQTKEKLNALPEGVGIDYEFNGLNDNAMVIHGYGNDEVSSSRYNQPINLPAFTNCGVLNDSYVTKLSNNQIRFKKNGLYMVDLRFSVKGSEKTAKIDICPYINGTAVRMLSISTGNEYVLNTYYTKSYQYLIDINDNDTFDIKCFSVYDEITAQVVINDIAITCIDSSYFFSVSNQVLTNRDSSVVYK